ncbi:TRAP transporter substrate-binding protein [Chloroflexota bacterium]
MLRKTLITLGASLMVVVLLSGLLVGCSSEPTTTTATVTATKTATTTATTTTVIKPIILKGDMIVSSAKHETAYQMLLAMDLIEERSGGRVVFDVNYGQVLVPLREAMTTVGKGALDWAWCGPSSFSGLDPRFNIAALPMAFTDQVQGFEALKTTPLADLLEQAANRQGVTLLGWNGHAPYVTMTTGKPVKVLADFEGQKIRAPGTALQSALQRLGAVPMNVMSAEIYPSMEKGIIDGAWLGLYTIESYKLVELIKYVTRGPFLVCNAQAIQINLEKFNTIPADLQKLMRDAFVEVEDEGYAYVMEENLRFEKMAADAGIEIYDPPKEELLKWVEIAGKPIWQDLRDEIGGADGDLFYNTLMDFQGLAR